MKIFRLIHLRDIRLVHCFSSNSIRENEFCIEVNESSPERLSRLQETKEPSMHSHCHWLALGLMSFWLTAMRSHSRQLSPVRKPIWLLTQVVPFPSACSIICTNSAHWNAHGVADFEIGENLAQIADYFCISIDLTDSSMFWTWTDDVLIDN